MSQKAAKVAGGFALAALLAGASYLYAVRGSAILIDLSAMIQGLNCF